MKKIVVAAIAAGFSICGLFAQALPKSTEDAVKSVLEDPDDPSQRKTMIIKPSNTHADLHPTATNVELEIDYVPLTNEARIYYTCMAVSFKDGEAMNTVMACLEDFQKDNNYYGYKHQSKARTKFFKDGRGVKMAQYSAFVKFTR